MVGNLEGKLKIKKNRVYKIQFFQPQKKTSFFFFKKNFSITWITTNSLTHTINVAEEESSKSLHSQYGGDDDTTKAERENLHENMIYISMHMCSEYIRTCYAQWGLFQYARNKIYALPSHLQRRQRTMGIFLLISFVYFPLEDASAAEKFTTVHDRHENHLREVWDMM